MDMFQRRTTFGGGFNAISAKLLFAGFRTGLAFESMNVAYNQQLVRLWDLDGDSGNTYLVAGHAMGRATIAKTIGPRATTNAFYERYGDVCRAAENTLMMETRVGCETTTGAGRMFGGTLRMTMSGVVLDGVQVALNAMDPVVRQSMGLNFVSMEWDERSNAQQAAQAAVQTAA